MRKGRDCIRWELLRARPTGYDEPREHQQGYAAYSLKEKGRLLVLKIFHHEFFFLFIARLSAIRSGTLVAEDSRTFFIASSSSLFVSYRERAHTLSRNKPFLLIRRTCIASLNVHALFLWIRLRALLTLFLEESLEEPSLPLG